jgi:hypothetical protein
MKRQKMPAGPNRRKKATVDIVVAILDGDARWSQARLVGVRGSGSGFVLARVTTIRAP